MKKILSAMALSIASFGAFADTLTLDGFEYNPGVTGTVQYGSKQVYAGVGALQATYSDGFGPDQSFLAFCVDLQHTAANFGTAVTYASYPAFQTALSIPYENLGKLFTFNDMQNDGILNGNGLASTTIALSAAMQLAVWELVYDPTPGSVTSGTFKDTASSLALRGNGITAAANALIAGALGTTTNLYDITYLTDDASSKNGGFQNYVTGVYNSNLGIGNVPAVPEPQTYAMLFAGLGVVGFMARNKRKTS